MLTKRIAWGFAASLMASTALADVVDPFQNQNASTAIVMLPGSNYARTLQSLFSEWGTATDYVADPTGFLDSTGAINSAASDLTGQVILPPGTYLITGNIALHQGQTLWCPGGPGSTTLHVDAATANLSAAGAVTFPTNYDMLGGGVRGCTINATQPDTAVRGSLVNFPPAIYARNNPNFTVDDVAITGSWLVGVDMRGNSGNSRLSRLRVSALQKGLWADGSLSYISLEDYNFFPWGLSLAGNIWQHVWGDGTNRAAVFGRVDGLKATNVNTIAADVEITSAANSNGAPLHMKGVHLDGANLRIAGGPDNLLSDVSAYANQATAVGGFVVSGGYTRVTGYKLAIGSTVPGVQVSAGTIDFESGLANSIGSSQPSFVVSGTGNLSVGTTRFYTNSTLTVAPIQATGAQNAYSLIVRGTTWQGNVGGGTSGNAVTVANDSVYNIITSDNSFENYTVSLPGGPHIGVALSGKINFVDLSTGQIGDASFRNDAGVFNLRTLSGSDFWTFNQSTGLFTSPEIWGWSQMLAPTMTPGTNTTDVATTAFVAASFAPKPLPGTTGSIGGSILVAGACASGTVAVTGSTTAMAVEATPATYPGDAVYWKGYVSTNGTVTVKVCVAIGATPTASTYNVRVIQ